MYMYMLTDIIHTCIYIQTHIKFLIYLLISVTGARILLPNHNYTQYIYEHSPYCTQVYYSILDSIPDTLYNTIQTTPDQTTHTCG